MLEAIEAILGLVAPILSRVIPDPAAQEAAKADIRKALLDSQSVIWQTSAQVMVADSQQDDKFTKRARPTLVYWALAYVTLITTTAPFGFGAKMIATLQAVPSDLWTLMTVGIGAFGASRAVEKGLSGLVKK